MPNNGSLQVHTVRFVSGQELKSSLEEFIKTHNLKAAFLMACVGSVVVLDKENFEICSLVGTVSGEGSHLHTVLSRADGTTVGGHVVGDMVVQTTAEVVVGESLGETYSREYDQATGFRELVVKKTS